MRIDGIQLAPGSSISNMVVSSGTSFPGSPDEGEMFFRTDVEVNVKGLYCYIGGSWDRIASSDSLTTPLGGSFPGVANAGDLFYLDSNSGTEGLYVFNGSAWVAAAASAPPTFTVTGDVTGTLDGGTDVLTLGTSGVMAGSYGGVTETLTATVDAKGRVTALNDVIISIAASQVSSGTFADARIAETNVTQHQAALSLAASQVTSGTFADARISQMSVTQHQAALTIAETQITDGALLARVSGNEVISGTWEYNNPVTVATPTTAGHATTKSYVDSVAQGLTTKPAVRAATTGNLTATYANGAAGVGATLTGTGSLPTIDGVTLSIGNGVLVKNQTSLAQNGRYNVTALSPWVLTRCSLCDEASEIPGAFVFVNEGTQAATGWVQTVADAATFVVGTDAITVTQFSGAGSYTAGTGLTLSGTTFNVNTASSERIVVTADSIDLATVTNTGTGTLQKLNADGYGRVTGTTPVLAADITTVLGYTPANRITTSSDWDSTTNGQFSLISGSTNGPNGITVISGAYFPHGGAGYGMELAGRLDNLYLRTEEADVWSSWKTVLHNDNFNVYAVPLIGGTMTGDLVINKNNATLRLSEVGTYHGTISTDSGGGINISSDPTNVAASSRVTFNVDGTERMRVTAAGEVGIGTNAPGQFVDIKKDQNSSTYLRIQNSTSGTAASAGISLHDGTTNKGLLIHQSAGYTTLNQFVADGTTLNAGGAGGLSLAAPNASTGIIRLYTGGTTERMRLTAAGDAGLGTTTPTNYGAGYKTFAVNGTTAGVVEWQVNGTRTAHAFANASSFALGSVTSVPVLFQVGNTERMRLDVDGRLLMNSAPQIDSAAGAIVNAGTSGDQLFLTRYNTSASAPVNVYLSRSRGAAVGTNTILAADDLVGNLIFRGANGTGFDVAAMVQASIDVTPGAGVDMPGRLTFHTTPDGSATAQERMRIDSAGLVSVWSPSGVDRITMQSTSGAISTLALGGVSGASGQASVVYDRNTGAMIFNNGSVTTPVERMRIAAGTGNVGIGTITAPTARLHVHSTAGGGDEPYIALTNAGTGSTSADGGFLGLTNTNELSLWNREAASLRFATSNIERMRIDASGNVAVGAADPATYGKFSVVNNTTRFMTVSATGVQTLRYDDNSLPFLTLQNLGVTAANHGYGLNFAIGSNGIEAVSAGRIAVFTEGVWTSGTASSHDSAMQFATTLNGALSERMRIHSSGNISVGTTSDAGGRLNVDAGSAAPLMNFNATSTNNFLRFQHSGTSIADIGTGNSIVSSGGSSSDFGINARTGNVIFSTGQVERVRVDTSGNLGISTTPYAWGGGQRSIDIGTVTAFRGDSASAAMDHNCYYNGTNFIAKTTGASTEFSTNGGNFYWYTGASVSAGSSISMVERARLTLAGEFLVGTQSNALPNPGVVLQPFGQILVGNNAQATGFNFIQFQRSATAIGSIAQNGTTAVQYNTTSDRRLKRDIADAPSAGSVIDAIQVRSFNWNDADEPVSHGFVAQELVSVVPAAVKRGDDGEQVTDTWGVDPSKLVALLVKEIQELRARVAALESA